MMMMTYHSTLDNMNSAQRKYNKKIKIKCSYIVIKTLNFLLVTYKWNKIADWYRINEGPGHGCI